MVRRRGREAGRGNLHPHQFRHSFAHNWFAEGGNKSDLMQLAGWRSRSMIDRYARSGAQDRATAASKKFGLGNRI